MGLNTLGERHGPQTPIHLNPRRSQVLTRFSRLVQPLHCGFEKVELFRNIIRLIRGANSTAGYSPALAPWDEVFLITLGIKELLVNLQAHARLHAINKVHWVGIGRKKK